MFSGMFRNVRKVCSRACQECQEHFQECSVCEEGAEVEHVFLHRGWVEYDMLVISSNFWMDSFTRNSKTTFIGILYTACIKRLIQGRSVDTVMYLGCDKDQ